MKQLRALTFDLDDTLWDNTPVLMAAEQSLYDWLCRHYPHISRHYGPDDMPNMRLCQAATVNLSRTFPVRINIQEVHMQHALNQLTTLTRQKNFVALLLCWCCHSDLAHQCHPRTS
ncbi:MAG: hypothetical protein WBO34_07295 [Gammaproteobacteria bacterium]